MALPRQAVFVFMSIRSMQSSTPGAPIGSNTWRGVRGCLESQTQNLGLIISRVWDMYTLPEIMELDELGWPGRACPPKVLGGG